MTPPAPRTAAGVRRLTVTVDVTPAVPLPGPHTVVADVHLPAGADDGPTDHGPTDDGVTALCCLPGGGMSRAYWDLDADGDDSYSFARHAARAGFVVITVDHLGTGESSQPEDGFALTVEMVAAADDHAVRRVLDGLRAGTLDGLAAPVPVGRTVGVGHSMGAMLTVIQQAAHDTHDRIALLGFSVAGLPQALNDDERAVAARGLPDAAALAELATARFGTPYPHPEQRRNDRRRGPRMRLHGPHTPQAARRAAAAAMTNILAVGGLRSILPGNAVAEAAAVTVPVFVGIAEHDLVTDAAEVPGQFPASADVTLYVQPEAWHNHNVAVTRRQLFARICTFAAGDAARGPDRRPTASRTL